MVIGDGSGWRRCYGTFTGLWLVLFPASALGDYFAAKGAVGRPDTGRYNGQDFNRSYRPRP